MTPGLAISIGSMFSTREPASLIADLLKGPDLAQAKLNRAQNLTATASTAGEQRKAGISLEAAATKDAQLRDSLSYLQASGALGWFLGAQSGTAFAQSLTGGYIGPNGDLRFKPTEFARPITDWKKGVDPSSPTRASFGASPGTNDQAATVQAYGRQLAIPLLAVLGVAAWLYFRR